MTQGIPLFLPFVCFQDLSGVLREISLGVSIGVTDIDDAICSAGPKPTDTQVPLIAPLGFYSSCGKLLD
jgi:hypothetical protein